MNEVFAASPALVTAYGFGLEPCWSGLAAGRHAFTPVRRFRVPDAMPKLAACVPEELERRPASESLPEHLLKLLAPELPELPPETPLYLALTVGEAERVADSFPRWTSDSLLEKARMIFRLPHARIYSGACASGNIALVKAFECVRSGRAPAVLAAACDTVGEFVFSGFASVNAMSPSMCRPYDASRDGLLLGDCAGAVLVANREFLRENGLEPVLKISGGAITADAFHAAAPEPTGIRMAEAVRLALDGVPPSETGLVIGHGTGTPLNDSMELSAAARVFPDGVPMVSVKGGTGHVLAASGILQLCCAEGIFRSGTVFPQTNLVTPDPAAVRYVSPEPRKLRKNRILSLNAGFGGINAAVLLEGM